MTAAVGSRTVTLSFDNGPDPDVTPRVLDSLAARGVRSTFFVIGRKLADPAARKLAERAHTEGHWIGNHTWTHGTPLGRITDAADSVAEIDRTQREIGSLAHPDKWFRPFGGGGRIGPWLLSAAARDYLVAQAFSVVLWNSIPRDWEQHDTWPERALADCRSQAHTLVVLHDHIAPSVGQLDRFIGTLMDEGFDIRQDFPEACVPLRRGLERAPLAPYVTD
jgi:peptidoglycan/xylan/chitin deacetylase (PgdA/CDA1 family)